jgi:hypothetical protein
VGTPDAFFRSGMRVKVTVPLMLVVGAGGVESESELEPFEQPVRSSAARRKDTKLQ